MNATKLLLGSAVATVALFVADEVLARAAVAHGAAGALLSPAGLGDPIAWLAAGGFFFARLASSAMSCVTVALAAAKLVSVIAARVPARSSRP